MLGVAAVTLPCGRSVAPMPSVRVFVWMGRASCRLDAARHGWRRRDGVRPHHHFQREAAATAFRGLWRRSLCRVGDCWAWRLSRCPVAVLWLPCHPFGLSCGWVGHRVGWMLPNSRLYTIGGVVLFVCNRLYSFFVCSKYYLLWLFRMECECH